MNCWVLNVGEPIPELDEGMRRFRYGMLTQALTEAGHSVVRWTSTFKHVTKDFRARNFFAAEHNDQLSFRFLHSLGYKLHRSPRRLLHHALEARQFREKAVLEKRPDIIVVSLPTLALAQAATEFGASVRSPVVLDISDCWPDHYLVFLPPLLRRLARPLLFYQYRSLRETLRRITAVTTISQTYLSWAYQRGKRPSTSCDKIFPIGYDASTKSEAPRFSPLLAQAGLKPSDFIILFVGAFAASYDFETILESARKLGPANQNIKFVLAGAGPYQTALKKKAAVLRNVVVLDFIQDQRELQNVISSATLGLCPYRADGSISLPNKPFEFMAAGKPVLSSLTGEFWDMVESEKIGRNYISSSPDSLLTAIESFLRDKTAPAEVGERGRRLFEARFTSEMIYPHFVKHLEGLPRAEPV